MPALTYSSAKKAFEPPSQPNESSLSLSSLSRAATQMPSTGEPASDSSFSAWKSRAASRGEGVSGSDDEKEEGKVEEGDRDGVKTSLGGELRRLARLVGERDGSSNVKLREVGEAEARAKGDIGCSSPLSSVLSSASLEAVPVVLVSIVGNVGPRARPNPRPMEPSPPPNEVDETLPSPKKGALTGLASVLARFFFGLRLVGLGKTPTAGELKALPKAQSSPAGRVVSTVRLRRLRRSTELDADDDDEDRKLKGCVRFLLDEGGGVRRLLSDILRAGFFNGDAPRVTVD